MLDLSRLESGVVPIERAPISASATPRARRDRLATERTGSGVDCSSSSSPTTSSSTADERGSTRSSEPGRNAIRHARRQRRASCSEDERPGTFLEVTDEGPGIPRAEAERVFERFYRSDQARSSGDGGSGLGLAIARWIVELHDGTIRTEERTPNGCRMIVELPE